MTSGNQARRRPCRHCRYSHRASLPHARRFIAFALAPQCSPFLCGAPPFAEHRHSRDGKRPQPCYPLTIPSFPVVFRPH